MNKIFIAGATILSAALLASAANAADVSAPAAYDWSGAYIGLNAGAAINNSSVNNDVRIDGTRIDELENNIEGDQTAFTGGALVGYNWQMDKIVLGVEADFNYLGFSQDDQRDWTEELYGVRAPLIGTSKASFEANWFGTLRGRIGYAADNVLFYGTGGLAYGHMEADAKAKIDYNVPIIAPSTPAEMDASTSSTNWGWTAGAGMEYGIDNWSLGVEYLYVDLGSAEWDGNSAADAIPADIKGDVDYQFSVVRATAKLRF